MIRNQKCIKRITALIVATMVFLTTVRAETFRETVGYGTCNFQVNPDKSTVSIIHLQGDANYVGVIPETVTHDGKTYTITAIGNRAYCSISGAYHYYSGKLVLPKTIRRIGKEAFAYNYVSEIVFSSKTEEIVIEESAFECCHSLKSINLSDLPLKRIERKTFYGSALSDVKLPSCLEYIGESSFSNCRIAEIEIPDNVRYIDNFAFGMDPNVYPGYQSLEKISMNPVALGRGVFAQCNKLKYVDWGHRLQRIGSQCFQGCTELEAVDLPLSLDSIFGSAFHSCSKLELISNLENVRFIDSYAFYMCESLKKVTIGCEVIGNNAFFGCTGLTDVTLKDGVRIIGSGVFSYGVPLTSITIPQSVDSIGYLAFPIGSLSEIKVYAQKPPVMGESYNEKVSFPDFG